MNNYIRSNRRSSSARGRPRARIRVAVQARTNGKQPEQAAIHAWEGEGGCAIEVAQERQASAHGPTRYSYVFPARWARLSPLAV